MSINIVIPMAGAGSRFANAGFELPKPFIDVNGKMMIECVLENLAYPNAQYILIARSEHIAQYPERIEYLQANYPVRITAIDKLTQGAACTVLAAHRLINNNNPLLIANSDQIVDVKIANFIDDCKKRSLDGSILTFEDNDSKWSFAKLNAAGLVTEVKEKQPISNKATVGIYLFSRGQDFISGVLDMIASADTVNNEYYVAPVYNYLIKLGFKIGVFDINKTQMHGTGTPADLAKYLDFLKLSTSELA